MKRRPRHRAYLILSYWGAALVQHVHVGTKRAALAKMRELRTADSTRYGHAVTPAEYLKQIEWGVREVPVTIEQ